MAIYSGRATDFPVGSPLSQIQPLDAFVFAGPGNKPSANLTETLIPGRQSYQLSNRQDTHSFNLKSKKKQDTQDLERIKTNLFVKEPLLKCCETHSVKCVSLSEGKGQLVTTVPLC